MTIFRAMSQDETEKHNKDEGLELCDELMNVVERKSGTQKGKTHFCLLEWRKLKFEDIE